MTIQQMIAEMHEHPATKLPIELFSADQLRATLLAMAAQLSGGPVQGTPDAPADGKTYGRKDGAWQQVLPLSLFMLGGVSGATPQVGDTMVWTGSVYEPVGGVLIASGGANGQIPYRVIVEGEPNVVWGDPPPSVIIPSGGTANQFLAANGSGGLVWATPSATETDDAVVTISASRALTANDIVPRTTIMLEPGATELVITLPAGLYDRPGFVRDVALVRKPTGPGAVRLVPKIAVTPPSVPTLLADGIAISSHWDADDAADTAGPLYNATLPEIVCEVPAGNDRCVVTFLLIRPHASAYRAGDRATTLHINGNAVAPVAPLNVHAQETVQRSVLAAMHVHMVGSSTSVTPVSIAWGTNAAARYSQSVVAIPFAGVNQSTGLVGFHRDPDPTWQGDYVAPDSTRLVTRTKTQEGSAMLSLQAINNSHTGSNVTLEATPGLGSGSQLAVAKRTNSNAPGNGRDQTWGVVLTTTATTGDITHGWKRTGSANVSNSGNWIMLELRGSSAAVPECVLHTDDGSDPLLSRSWQCGLLRILGPDSYHFIPG